MAKWFWKTVEWLGRVETLHTIAQAEFVRTLLMPTVVAVLTGTAGIFGGVPIMWVIMASSVAFGGTMMGLLLGSIYVERKNPRTKLVFQAAEVLCDLLPTTVPAPIPPGNRQQRKAAAKTQVLQTLGPNQLVFGVNRQIDRCNIGVKVLNTSTFPISCYIQFSETQIEGFTPPRVTFPRDKMTILPGNSVTFRDERIQMNGHACQRLVGKMDFWLKYGLQGREIFDLKLKGNLDIQMETWGLPVAIAVAWTD